MYCHTCRSSTMAFTVHADCEPFPSPEFSANIELYLQAQDKYLHSRKTAKIRQSHPIYSEHYDRAFSESRAAVCTVCYQDITEEQLCLQICLRAYEPEEFERLERLPFRFCVVA